MAGNNNVRSIRAYLSPDFLRRKEFEHQLVEDAIDLLTEEERRGFPKEVLVEILQADPGSYYKELYIRHEDGTRVSDEEFAEYRGVAAERIKYRALSLIPRLIRYLNKTLPDNDQILTIHHVIPLDKLSEEAKNAIVERARANAAYSRREPLIKLRESLKGGKRKTYRKKRSFSRKGKRTSK